MGALSGLFLIVRRSLRQHLLSTLVTVVSLALGSGLVMAIFTVHDQSRQAFTPDDMGFDAVLGARGSKLQLVLNTVFHLETSPGNIPWSMYQEIKNDPFVDLAIPYATGDNYHGFRIVGTTEEIFTHFEYREGRKFEFAAGEKFDSRRQSAVVGSAVARKRNLQVGSIIQPYHGLDFNPNELHDVDYRVCGIIEPTNTPSDKVIWIPIEGIFRMPGHALRGKDEDELEPGESKVFVPKAGEQIPNEWKEVSAVMLRFHRDKEGKVSHRQAMRLDLAINKGDAGTLAYPIQATMMEIFDKLGWLVLVLEIVAYLVVVIAAASILASIYNTMNERRREFAILRALGATRVIVFSAIVLEASAIAGLGALLGFAVYVGILFSAQETIQQYAGVVLDVGAVGPVLWLTPLAMMVLGALSGILPAIKAYSTDVASNLVPSS